MECLFCKIDEKKRTAKIIYEDDFSIAFEDINPQAPVHTLVIPKKHISTNLDMKEEDNNLIGHMFQVANKIAKDKGIADRGFRLVMNCNPESGQNALRRAILECRIKRTLIHPYDVVTSVAFSPDGSTLATGCEDCIIRLWDVFTGEMLKELTGTNWVLSLAYHPQKGFLASASGDRTVKIWDPATGNNLFCGEHPAGLRSVVFSLDGKRMATGGDQGIIKLWDTADWLVLRSLSADEETGMDVWDISFSPDGKYLASVGLDMTIRLWDVETGNLQFTMLDENSSTSASDTLPQGASWSCGTTTSPSPPVTGSARPSAGGWPFSCSPDSGGRWATATSRRPFRGSRSRWSSPDLHGERAMRSGGTALVLAAADTAPRRQAPAATPSMVPCLGLGVHGANGRWYRPGSIDRRQGEPYT